MREKQKVTRELRGRYRNASKQEKGEILDWLVEVTGYNRSYASRVLRGKASAKKEGKKKEKRGRKRRYGEEVFLALREVWFICDCICSKRLAPFLQEIVPVLERHNELIVSDEVREKLFEISPSTVDRMLAPVKKTLNFKGRSTTKPGILLKDQIPVRTFTEWDEDRPGFVEVDLVAHCGDNAGGDFIQTLDLTDVYTGWTETKAVKNKAQVWVFEALQEIRKRLPFKLKGIDSDNGGEFINSHLFRYCEEEEITFTRARPYRKNDSCFVEQKNWSIVRKTVGYNRYDTEEELEALNELYRELRLYTNFFQPVMKLKEKRRVGSKVKKRYDKARTPCRRVLESPQVSERKKENLKEEYQKLNPAELNRKVEELKKRLWKINQMKGNQH